MEKKQKQKEYKQHSIKIPPSFSTNSLVLINRQTSLLSRLTNLGQVISQVADKYHNFFLTGSMTRRQLT